MENILSVQKLHKSFGGIKAVNDCSFTVKKNSITGLIGPNGAGKTTMFNLLTGIFHADSGEINFEGKKISKLPTDKRARLGLARTFQSIRIFPALTLIDNIKVALRDNKTEIWEIFLNQKKLQSRLEFEAMELLRTVNLHELSHKFAGELSYGQQKLLEIVRAVATNPKIILLDEPAAGINPTMLRHIIDYIKKFQKSGKTILLIEHDMGFVMELCEKIIVMDYGKEIAVGTPKEIQKNPLVLEAYLGKKHA